MASCSHYHPAPNNGRGPVPPPVPTTSCPPEEPAMHRYPHPIVSPASPPPVEVADLHFLRCTLVYQNQLLADIKALLQALLQQGDSNAG